MTSEPRSELLELEAEALRAILAGRAFADAYRSWPVKIRGPKASQLEASLRRLDDTDLFSVRDENIWPRFEAGLVSALNEIRDGYGQYTLREDTRYDQLFLPELENGRRLMECWKAFRDARQAMLDRRRAARIGANFAA